MHPRTVATLDQLRREDWFRNVGVRDTELADVLSSWDEAIASCASLDWENLGLEAANQYRERLLERDRGAMATWNATVKLVKPAALALVREKTSAIIEANQLPKIFLNNVNWDIVHLLMECEYAETHPPWFYASKAYWYLNGHFPCGWRGPLHGGRLLVY